MEIGYVRLLMPVLISSQEPTLWEDGRFFGHLDGER